jgi:AcrR family transcriptional regulator
MAEATLRQDQFALRRLQLIEAARRLFAERGYHATSIRDLHREVGVSDGLLYHNFPSKLELLHAVLEDGFQGMLHHRLGEDITQDMSVPEALRFTGSQLWDYWLQMEDVMRILISEHRVLEEAGDTFLPQAFMRSARGLSDFLAERQRRGEVRADLDPELATREFINSLLGQYVFGVIIAGEKVIPTDMATYVEQVVEMLWNGWTARA